MPRKCPTGCTCGRHKKRPQRPVRERFFEKTAPDEVTRCLLWVGSRDGNGYGTFAIQGRTRRAHVVAWFLKYGTWPDLNVLHRCDNPPCVKADHLFLGTQTDNMRDAASKGRNAQQRKTHCVHGHPLSGPNLLVRVDHGATRRICLTCRRATDEKHHPRVGVPAGGRPRLTESDVLTIRGRYPGTPVIQLAREHGVTVGTIHNVITRRTWRKI